MKHLWNYRFEICIAISGMVLLGSVFLPHSMPAGIHICMLTLFLISLILLKLSAINKHLKNKINRGGNI